jgi:hypothetical protein
MTSQHRLASALSIGDVSDSIELQMQEPTKAETMESRQDNVEKRSYPFPVWSGLLSRTHRQRIGIALWTFLWFVDRITSDKEGWGLVLGGKPVKDSEIATSFGLHKNSIHRDRETLLNGGYIQAVRTPYGFRYRVRKSRKFGIWGKRKLTTNSDSPRAESLSVVTLESPFVVGTKKTMQLDHAVESRGSIGKPSLEVDDGESEANRLPPWRAIGVEEPFGNIGFRHQWVTTFEQRIPGETVERIMERCAVQCQDFGIRVPARFYELKRLVERATPAVSAPNIKSRDLGADSD